ncbi:hypothetical protein ABK040_011105 [Willaertia magna]
MPPSSGISKDRKKGNNNNNGHNSSNNKVEIVHDSEDEDVEIIDFIPKPSSTKQQSNTTNNSSNKNKSTNNNNKSTVTKTYVTIKKKSKNSELQQQSLENYLKKKENGVTPTKLTNNSSLEFEDNNTTVSSPEPIIILSSDSEVDEGLKNIANLNTIKINNKNNGNNILLSDSNESSNDSDKEKEKKKKKSDKENTTKNKKKRKVIVKNNKSKNESSSSNNEPSSSNEEETEKELKKKKLKKKRKVVNKNSSSEDTSSSDKNLDKKKKKVEKGGKNEKSIKPNKKKKVISSDSESEEKEKQKEEVEPMSSEGESIKITPSLLETSTEEENEVKALEEEINRSDSIIGESEETQEEPEEEKEYKSSQESDNSSSNSEKEEAEEKKKVKYKKNVESDEDVYRPPSDDEEEDEPVEGLVNEDEISDAGNKDEEEDTELIPLHIDEVVEPKRKKESKIPKFKLKCQEIIQDIANMPKLTSHKSGWKVDKDGDYYLDDKFVLNKKIFEKLYSFQKEGIKWLYQRYSANQFNGGILADEMGLGKTVQVSAFLGGLANLNAGTKFLILAPVSVLATWKKEMNNWSDGVNVHIMHMTSSTQVKDLVNKFNKSYTLPTAIITTNRTFSNNIELFEDDDISIDCTIIDEAHSIKNDETEISKSLRKIGSRAKFCLTGTPIMNNLMEMWSIYDYLFYGDPLLGSKKDFRENYERKIVKSRKRDATDRDKMIGNALSSNLRHIIEKYFLRRQKSEVLETDHKIEKGEAKAVGKAKISQKDELVLWVSLSECQRHVYQSFLTSPQVAGIVGKSERHSLLSSMSALKMLCDHPRIVKGWGNLITKYYNKDKMETDESETVAQVGEENDIIDPSLDEKGVIDIKSVSAKELIEESNKLKVLFKLLEMHKKEGHKTLVFSQYKTMLDVIEKVLKKKNYSYKRIDGETPGKERQRRVDDFNTIRGISCFLLTTGVGGVGLTLTGADRVILFDIHWNPAVDQQAVDRAYRVGQKRNVITYRLVSVGTIEEIVYRKQVSKDGLVRNTITKENQYRYFTSEQEIVEVFTLRNTQSSETQSLLAACNHEKKGVYDILEEHLSEVKDFEEVTGTSWHDVLYSVESDEKFEDSKTLEAYGSDAKVQQRNDRIEANNYRITNRNNIASNSNTLPNNVVQAYPHGTFVFHHWTPPHVQNNPQPTIPNPNNLTFNSNFMPLPVMYGNNSDFGADNFGKPAQSISQIPPVSETPVLVDLQPRSQVNKNNYPTNVFNPSNNFQMHHRVVTPNTTTNPLNVIRFNAYSSNSTNPFNNVNNIINQSPVPISSSSSNPIIVDEPPDTIEIDD